MSFSKRQGYSEEPLLQFECMSDDLKLELHNIIRLIEDTNNWTASGRYEKLKQVYSHLWSHFFILDSDEFKRVHARTGVVEVKKLYDQLPWNQVYDYIEEYCRLISVLEPIYYDKLCRFLNIALEKHNSAYRMTEGKIVPITSQQELAEVSGAGNTTHQAINKHIKRAIELFSNRESKDYSNTVKEAISAVEAAANLINGTQKSTLSDALKVLSKHSTIHPALVQGFINIYGYTSDGESGIRHALCEDAKNIPDFADAKFMLVSCSAFVIYLLQKADRSGA